MGNLNFIDVLLFIGASQGIFLAVGIQLIQNKNKDANVILSLILVMFSIMLLGRFALWRFFSSVLHQWAVALDFIIFIFGPFCYLYFRRLVFAEQPKYRLDWVHYIPMSIHLFYCTYLFTLNSDVYGVKMHAGAFNTPFLIMEFGGISSMIFYSYLNIRLFHRYRSEVKNSISYTQNIIHFLKLFQTIIGFFTLFWLVSFIAYHFFRYAIPVFTYNIIWACMAMSVFLVGYYSLKNPEFFRIHIADHKAKVRPKRLSSSQVKNLKDELNFFILEKKIYLNPNLTLRELSELLSTSTHNLSWYLNNECHSNFYDYVNKYRIQAFLDKVENKEHVHSTILGLSMDVGFNSKSTFNKAFKIVMNDTPSNYIKSLDLG